MPRLSLPGASESSALFHPKGAYHILAREVKLQPDADNPTYIQFSYLIKDYLSEGEVTVKEGDRFSEIVNYPNDGMEEQWQKDAAVRAIAIRATAFGVPMNGDEIEFDDFAGKECKVFNVPKADKDGFMQDKLVRWASLEESTLEEGKKGKRRKKNQEETNNM